MYLNLNYGTATVAKNLEILHQTIRIVYQVNNILKNLGGRYCQSDPDGGGALKG